MPDRRHDFFDPFVGAVFFVLVVADAQFSEVGKDASEEEASFFFPSPVAEGFARARGVVDLV